MNLPDQLARAPLYRRVVAWATTGLVAVLLAVMIGQFLYGVLVGYRYPLLLFVSLTFLTPYFWILDASGDFKSPIWLVPSTLWIWADLLQWYAGTPLMLSFAGTAAVFGISLAMIAGGLGATVRRVLPLGLWVANLLLFMMMALMGVL
jgi:hypothetical protein